MLVLTEWQREQNRICELCFTFVENRPDGTAQSKRIVFISFGYAWWTKVTLSIVVVGPYPLALPTQLFGKRVLYLRHSVWRASVRIRDRGEATRHEITYGADELPTFICFCYFSKRKTRPGLSATCTRNHRIRPKSSKPDDLCLSARFVPLVFSRFLLKASRPPQRPAAVGNTNRKWIGIPTRCYRHSRRLKNTESYTLFPVLRGIFLFPATLIIRVVFSVVRRFFLNKNSHSYNNNKNNEYNY